MAEITGLHLHEFTSGTSELIAMWAKTPMVRKSTYWMRGPTLTADKQAHMASFINNVFLVNYTDNNYAYNGSAWTYKNTEDSPIAQYIIPYATRLYLYKIKIAGVEYPSRAWFCDYPVNGEISWGLETGSDLVQTADSNVITSAGSSFKQRGIKVGDPLFITSGTNARRDEYVVQSIDSETQITLDEDLTNSATGSSFWVGGNWFDVNTDDGDFGMGMGLTSNYIIFFKKKSILRFIETGSTRELRQIKNAVGTTSSRSIVSKGDYVYWYHPSGIYRTNGADYEIISNPIEDVVDGITSGNESAVVGWKNETYDTVNFYLGDVTLRDGDTISGCVVSFDENTETWAPRSYSITPKVATDGLESDSYKVYVGDNSDSVYQFDTGTDFNDSNISTRIELAPIYPEDSETIIEPRRVRLYISNGPDVQLYYKLLYKPNSDGITWDNDAEWRPMKGSQNGDRAEWVFPVGERASGVKFLIVENSNNESFYYEKLVLYYSNPANY